MVIRAHSIRWNFQDYYFDAERQISIDNFKPYVTRVRIEQQERAVKYEAHWPETPASDYDLGALILDKDDYCKVGKLLTFLIEFSEDMKTDVLPILQVEFPNGGIKTVPSGEWIGSNVYRAVTDSSFIPPGASGRATLQISGAYDLISNYQISNIFITRDFENSGIDTNNKFYIICRNFSGGNLWEIIFCC